MQISAVSSSSSSSYSCKEHVVLSNMKCGIHTRVEEAEVVVDFLENRVVGHQVRVLFCK